MEHKYSTPSFPENNDSDSLDGVVNTPIRQSKDNNLPRSASADPKNNWMPEVLMNTQSKDNWKPEVLVNSQPNNWKAPTNIGLTASNEPQDSREIILSSAPQITASPQLSDKPTPAESVIDIIRERCDASVRTERKYNFYTYTGVEKKWFVPDTNIGNFLYDYCTFIASKPEIWDGKVIAPGLAQKVEDYMPVVFKFTFPFNYPDENLSESGRADYEASLWDNIFLKDLVIMCRSVIMENLNYNGDNARLKAVILVSPRTWTSMNSNIKCINTMIQVQFPKCTASVQDQKNLLFPAFVNKAHDPENGIDLPKGARCSWDTSLDRTVFDRDFVMYGSTEDRSIPPLHFHSIVEIEWAEDDDGEGDEGDNPEGGDKPRPISLEGEFQMNILNLQEEFNPAEHEYARKSFIDLQTFQNEPDPMTWLPLLLSANYYSVPSLAKNRIIVEPKPQKEIKYIAPELKLMDPYLGNITEMVHRFLQGINARKRCKSTNEWLDIGKALYNIYGGNDAGLRMWTEFCKKGGRNADKCPDYYEEMSSGNYLSVATLAKYYSDDDLDGYNTWRRKWITDAFDNSIEGAPNEVAVAAARSVWPNYIFGSMKAGKSKDKRGWWYYDKSRGKWMAGDIAFEQLERFILDDFRETLRDYMRDWRIKVTDGGSDINRRNADITMKLMDKIIAKLGDETYVKKIISLMRLRASTRFCMRSIMDANKYIMAHDNCVWEVLDPEKKLPTEDHLIVRSAKPEDFITMSTNLQYNKNMHWGHPKVREVMEYMHQLHTNPEVCEFAITYDSSVIEGGNKDKVIVLRPGITGNNSKTQDQKLKMITFGDYAKVVSTAVLSSKSNESGKANPEEASLIKARLAICFEPEADEKMKTGKVKEMTGNDDRYIRTLYDEGECIEQTYKFTIFTNHKQRVTEADQAIKIRVLILEYLSRWSKDAPKDKAEQYRQRHFEEDPDFPRKLKTWGPAYAWVLCQYFNTRYKASKYLRVPQIIRDRTNKYWDENDIYNLFINQKLVRATNPDGSSNHAVKVHYDAVWREFMKWYNDCQFDRKTKPDLQKAIENLQVRMGDLVVNNWLGWGIQVAANATAGG